MIECSDCGALLANQVDSCPHCGSVKKQVLINIQDVLQLDEEASFSITQHNSFWNLLPDSLLFLVNQLEDEPFRLRGVGFSIQIMISSAMLAEGLLTDCLEEGLDQARKNGVLFAIKDREVEYATWKDKKALLKRVLAIDVEELPRFEEVDILFQIRNNIGHGRSYKVSHTTVFRNHTKPHSSEIEIKNRNYASVYQKVEKMGLVPPLQHNSELNIDLLFKPGIAKYLYKACIEFLRTWMATEPIICFEKIQRDFAKAFGTAGSL